MSEWRRSFWGKSYANAVPWKLLYAHAESVLPLGEGQVDTAGKTRVAKRQPPRLNLSYAG